MAFFAFIGFDGVSSMAEEAISPKQDLPKAIIGSLFITNVIYMAVAFMLVGTVKYSFVSTEDPLADAFRDTPWIAGIIALGAVFGIFTVMLTSILGQSRIYYSMARDGLISPSFCEVTSSNHSPTKAVLLSGIPAAIVALFFRVNILGHITSLGACSAFILVCATVLQRRFESEEGSISITWRVCLVIFSSIFTSISIYGEYNIIIISLFLFLLLFSSFPFFSLKKTDMSLSRSDGRFLTPFVPLVPLLGISLTVHIMIGQGEGAFTVYALWVLIGQFIYFLYGRKHSKIGQQKSF